MIRDAEGVYWLEAMREGYFPNRLRHDKRVKLK